LRHRGFGLIDVISPCVTFNDHEASTKSYRFTREHHTEMTAVDYVPLRREIAADSEPDASGRTVSVTMHDGSVVRFRRVAEDYDPTDRDAAYAHVRALQQKKEIATGLLYIDGSASDMHAVNRTVERPLVELPFEELCPGNAALAELMEEFR
jgi:2-oxoglutarate ferredoxin oxidoreductase subunit beta